MPCELCERTGEIVFESQGGRVLLHPDSAVAGHAMVVAPRHVENLSDLDAAERAAFATLHANAERALLDITRTDRAILVKLGIQVPHLHIHIYPVRNTMTRGEVMKVIDGEVREVRTEGFAEEVRKRLQRLTSPA